MTCVVCLFFFFNDTATTEIYTLSLHDALPILRVQGRGIPMGHTVWVAGREVPVDPQGNFAAEEILPAGAHTVEVAVLDDAGNGSLYLRDLELKRKDLFYLLHGDVTVSANHTSGPGKQLQGEN